MVELVGVGGRLQAVVQRCPHGGGALGDGRLGVGKRRVDDLARRTAVFEETGLDGGCLVCDVDLREQCSDGAADAGEALEGHAGGEGQDQQHGGKAEADTGGNLHRLSETSGLGLRIHYRCPLSAEPEPNCR